jgi:hypothetical protein
MAPLSLIRETYVRCDPGACSRGTPRDAEECKRWVGVATSFVGVETPCSIARPHKIPIVKLPGRSFDLRRQKWKCPTEIEVESASTRENTRLIQRRITDS